jgi:hypothetical protein
MATRTVTAADYLRPYRGPVRVKNGPEDASETFALGAILTFGVASGHENRVAEVGDDPTTVIGVAAQAASGDTDTSVPYWIAEAGVEFIGVVQDTGTLDQTQLVAAGYGVVYDSTNKIWRVDLSDTSHKVVKITELIDNDGDVNGRVAFQFLAAVRQPFAG